MKKSGIINKILVPLDGSEHANQALSYALELADKFSAEIQVLSVVPPILLPSYSFKLITSQAIEDFSSQLERSFLDILSIAEERVKKEKPLLKISTKLEKGDPDNKIIETANLGNFDIIIMGCRGLGDKEFGSVSYRVTSKVSCPVLLVK